MTRPLALIPAEPAAVLLALREALGGSGPAILPIAAGGGPAAASAPPSEVARRIALVVETSGSTGAPKRVALSADALLASAAAADSALGGAGQWLLALPVHYIAGLNVLLRSITGGTEPVVLPAGPFDPLAFAAAADRLDAPQRFTSLVPAQLARLLESEQATEALRCFDRVLIGGQSTPPALAERATRLGIAVTRSYGSSETCGGCVYDGVPIGNTELRIADGQLEVAGSVLADGYLGDERCTAEAFVVDSTKRWYRTGDSGQIVDGLLRVTGRLDDVIISGGIKVSLAAIERELRALPGQQDAVVVRAPSERWGEVPVVVTARSIDLEPLRARLSAALGPAAAPERVLVLAELPMLDSGKPDRHRMQRLAQ